ncbi:unnamed protein product [Peniophora sp. CBMAI 1063]|nr:unnamed protein product [Peniophora sp. CBMAI 1063]
MSADLQTELAKLSPPKLSQSVHREECTQCFDNQDTEHGVDVCLHCFNGGCLSTERHHARDHATKTGHRFALNVRRRLKPSSHRGDDEEPPAKMTKLAIVEEREEDKYEFITSLRDWQTGQLLPDPAPKHLVDGVLTAMSSARQSEVKAWEEEIVACEHTLMLHPESTGPIEASGLAHCKQCDLKENLWLCLTCGSLGCGRQLYGGLGGNGHGLAHYQETHHPVAVKLGTITPEGNADIYCYICDDAKTDPELPAHLAAFGINVASQTKTEKSMTELQLEHNLRFDFSLTDESGKALEPVFGPGLTGLANLGNSCYMASVLQTLFTLPAFRERYYAPAAQHWATCTETLPASCLECQMVKIADGLCSGRYSVPRTKSETTPKSSESLQHDSPAPVFQEGVRPASFKALVGKGHEEFASMRQQDAEEFLAHLLTSLRRTQHAQGTNTGGDATQIFAFEVEQRLQCGTCGGVRYRTDAQDALSVPVPARKKSTDEDGKTTYEDVPLSECLDMALNSEQLSYRCPKCAKDVQAVRGSRLSTFPDVLVVHAKKFTLVNWVPTKVDVPVILPDGDTLVLDGYKGNGLREGEVALPEETAAAPALPTFNADAMAMLAGMGFPEIRCQKALLATGNDNAEVAMEWLFAHMDDPDIDAPIQLPGAGARAGPEPSAEQVAMLADMGFTSAQASKALRETGGNPERAIEWLFSHPDDDGSSSSAAPASDSAAQEKKVVGNPNLPAKYRLRAFVSHKGPSVHSGHYVAHIRQGETDDWVLFNDEKVVKADAESVRTLKALAYMWVWERV